MTPMRPPATNDLALKGLVGRHVLINGHDTYRTGQVVERLTKKHYLVQFDDYRGRRWPPEMFHLNEMLGEFSIDGKSCGKAWQFFDDAEQLRLFVDWMIQDPLDDGARGLKVVKLRSS
jgi:hypothetical protein